MPSQTESERTTDKKSRIKFYEMPESVIAESFRQILLKIGNASWWTFSLRNFAHENKLSWES